MSQTSPDGSPYAPGACGRNVGFMLSRKSCGVREYQCVIVPKSLGAIMPRLKAYVITFLRSSPRNSSGQNSDRLS